MVKGRYSWGKCFKSVKLALVSFGAVLVVLSGGWTCTQLTYLRVRNISDERTNSSLAKGRYLNAKAHVMDPPVLNYMNSMFHKERVLKANNETNLLLESASSAHRQQEVRHIAFLKVHKAASSTMQNIFFRFGLKRNLTFVFTKHPNYFSRSPNFHIPLARPRFRNGYDILCNHGVFNYKIYSSLLPSDTVYVGIVRDPLAVFVSAVHYYSLPSQRIDYIARVPGNKLKNLIHKPERYDRHFFSYTKNVMARDFGFPETLDSNRIQDKLRELDSIFKLVLLVEHFEESLVLMKRYLFWDIKDILFLSNNVHNKGNSFDLSPDDIEQFKVRNSLDYTLYSHFYERFWMQFRSEHDDILDEVEHFKSVLDNLKSFCSNSGVHLGVFIVPTTEWNEKFSVDFTECDYMKKDELSFISILRKKQGSHLFPYRY